MVVWLDWVIRVIIIGIVITACILDLTHNRKPPKKYPLKFIFIRFLNWLTIGLTYACTYFGRYNLQVLNTTDVHHSMDVTVTQFGVISTCGYITYAVFVVINGYFVDRFKINIFYLFIFTLG
jgi:sugar phosphate permease